MTTYSRTSLMNDERTVFNKIKLDLKWADRNREGIGKKFNRLKMLLTNYLTNPNHLRIDNNTRFRIF